MAVARALVQGCDVWLNTPLRPLEASGTSGMKALANGALNVSTLDCWWDEAWHYAAAKASFVGWAIGRGEKYENADYQDQVEAAALYDLLESEIVPAFYERSADGLPRRWVAYMKSSIGTLSYSFNAQRMVKDYTAEFYVKAHQRCEQLVADGAKRARQVAAWVSRLEREWSDVRVETVDAVGNGDICVGDRIQVQARVHLGNLVPNEVTIELYLGQLNADGQISSAKNIAMSCLREDNGIHLYEAKEVPCERSGRNGYTVCVRPFHADEARSFLPGLIRWADELMANARAV
jgi:glycogen phosphorylase